MIIWKIQLELHLPIMNHFNMNQIICSNVSYYYPPNCSHHSHLGKMKLLHQSCNNDLPLLDYSHLWPAGPGPISSPECCQDAASNNHLTSLLLLRHPSFSVSWQQLIFYQAGILSHDPPWILYNLIFAPARKYFYSNNNNEMAQFPFTESGTLSLHNKYFFPFHPNIFSGSGTPCRCRRCTSSAPRISTTGPSAASPSARRTGATCCVWWTM